MRRDPLPYLVLILLLGGFAGLAWLTRNPDSEVLREAEEWPVIGPLASGLRDRYLPKAGGSDPQGPRVYEPASPQPKAEPDEDIDLLSARPFVWVVPGTRVYEQPDTSSNEIETIEAFANLQMYEQRGSWYRVRRGRTLGWVFVDRQRESGDVPLGSGVQPVLPVPARPADPERLAAGLGILGDDAVQTSLGPYEMFSDVSDDGLLFTLRSLATELEGQYAVRYGQLPVGRPAETILLFSGAGDYRSFVDQDARLGGVVATGHVAEGVVALYAGDRDPDETASTLVHEVVHLLNRRALGPALPPWLDEGIADDLALSRIDASGNLEPGTIGGRKIVEGRRVLRTGALASAAQLLQALDRDELPPITDLLELDWQSFVTPGRSELNYAQSAFWVRFLLSDWLPGTGSGFRAYLAGVASGKPVTSEEMTLVLGKNLKELEEGFRLWLKLQFIEPPIERQ